MTGEQIDYDDHEELEVAAAAPLISPTIVSPTVPAPVVKTAAPDSRENNCLYINGLSWWTTEEDIRDALDGLVVPRKIVFLEAKLNGRSRGIAIAEFDDKNICQKALDILTSKYSLFFKILLMNKTLGK